ncbi:hypothetical protein AN189_01505 [Loktanella sp. 3ANDIMAR09]|uniref:hypothetical protein n=1 Tax=Loktanella sp. 3ANDIMAR09 TaxID=1225657 RepID=UPI000701C8C8|nr:hypothetical protein [Loktanella sp. 3ANDIMAR09]KQI70101.1 hypothetical protein AN189_01505 [Loktanella sp. 3ANDIMAR09]
MDQPGDVVFYLDSGLLNSARAGKHNFIGLVAKCLTDAGLRVFFEPNTLTARNASARRPGYSLFHMDEPTHPRALTLRRNYFYPFWQIETSARRWEWAVALSRFDKAQIDRKEATRFFNFWRKRLYPGLSEDSTRHGPLYMPLQGMVREHRSFQSCSPIEMIKRTAERFPYRDVILTLHPNESYSQDDHAALHLVEDKYDNVSISARPMTAILPGCSAVVTQNSSVALAGFLFRKPAVIFAQIDFHHIAGNVPKDGEDKAFKAITQFPDFEGYVWWFLQQMSINAGRPEAPDKIAATLRRHGWPV